MRDNSEPPSIIHNSISCQDRTCIFYVTPLARKKVKAEKAAVFVEFIALEECSA